MEINNYAAAELRDELSQICGARRWVALMQDQFPVANTRELKRVAQETWAQMKEADWLEAFQHHPRIGDLESLKTKFAGSPGASEQAGSFTAAEAILKELQQQNEAYLKKFGFIFIVCATGKSANEMLSTLKTRLKNERSKELANAAAEQEKIMLLRLEKL